MGLMTPPAPPNVTLPPPSAHPPTLGSASAALAAQTVKDKAVKADGQGMDDTVKTSPQGLQAPATAKATLLGGSGS